MHCVFSLHSHFLNASKKRRTTTKTKTKTKREKVFSFLSLSLRFSIQLSPGAVVTASSLLQAMISSVKVKKSCPLEAEKNSPSCSPRFRRHFRFLIILIFSRLLFFTPSNPKQGLLNSRSRPSSSPQQRRRDEEREEERAQKRLLSSKMMTVMDDDGGKETESSLPTTPPQPPPPSTSSSSSSPLLLRCLLALAFALALLAAALTPEPRYVLVVDAGSSGTRM